eukprot:TRINITY_DN5157_c0_g1_i1.p1 TRINITY_DN5157_c0_g1~~TRINITY_DN5157_c0_g1_i1.p1  ORF type:complete len:204 (-),score=59.83 TRINITY_DN5157_c0_g1_i1:103-714(-)
MTFFSPVTHNLTQLDASADAIPLSPFLSCCSYIVSFVDVLGPTTFAMVRTDMNGNIDKLKKHQAKNPTQFTTVQELIKNEIAAKSTKESGSATDALLWLKRALEFIAKLLQEVLAKPDELTTLASNAYYATLANYHGWVVRGVFTMALSAVPYRKDFLEKLGKGNTEAVTLQDMKAFLDAFLPTIEIINSFYAANGLNDERAV